MAGELVFRGRRGLVVVYRFDQVGKAVGGFGAYTGGQVLVGVNRERRVGVGEAQVLEPNVGQAVPAA